LPAFTPPTWMVLSYIKVFYHPTWFLLALTGAIAATLGRMLLAKLSTIFLRNKILKESTVKNIDFIKEKISQHQTISFAVFLFYAFSPFPSNQIFIAYGLTGFKLKLIAIPFFIGRLISYSFWIITASEVQHHLAANIFKNKSFFTGYFLIVQVLTLVLVYLFAKIDWRELFVFKKLRLKK
jgi:hypothetical protein